MIPARTASRPVWIASSTASASGSGGGRWTPSERADLKKVFTAGRPSTFADGIDAVVRVMMLSPQFMYRIEQGVPVPGAGYERLDHWDMASRLSYLLWGIDARRRAVRRPPRRASWGPATRWRRRPGACWTTRAPTAMVTNFAGQWLHLRELADADKDTTLYPAWKEEYLALFRQETEEFVAAGLEGGRQAGHAAVGALHLRERPAGGLLRRQGASPATAFQKVTLDAAQRAGVLTHASFLAAKSGPDQSSPILRGVFVREQMFCQPLPQPPVTVDANPPS